MIGQISVYRDGPDVLSQELWVFSLLGTSLVLDHYSKFTRKTKRHKPVQTGPRYDRLKGGRHDIAPRLQEQDVPWREDVNAEALATLQAMFKVERWSEHLSGRF